MKLVDLNVRVDEPTAALIDRLVRKSKKYDSRADLMRDALERHFKYLGVSVKYSNGRSTVPAKTENPAGDTA